MKKIEYKDQYKHPLWQKKRLEILKRDNFRCCSCGVEGGILHVHHGYYEINKNIWEYDNLTLVSLCEECHIEVDKNKRMMYEKIARMGFFQWPRLDSYLDEQLKQLNK